MALDSQKKRNKSPLLMNQDKMTAPLTHHQNRKVCSWTVIWKVENNAIALHNTAWSTDYTASLVHKLVDKYLLLDVNLREYRNCTYWLENTPCFSLTCPWYQPFTGTNSTMGGWKSGGGWVGVRRHMRKVVIKRAVIGMTHVHTPTTVVAQWCCDLPITFGDNKWNTHTH